MTGRLHLPHPHLPHPHLADLFIGHIGAGFWEGMFHRRALIIPAVHDWDDFHWPDGSGYVEVTDDRA